MAELIFNETQLRKLKRQCLHHNVFPMEISHHRVSPAPVAEILNPIIADCLEQMSEMSGDEIVQVVNSLSAGYRQFLQPYPEVATPEFLERVAEYSVAAELQKDYSPVSEVVEPKPDNSQVLEQCPELAERIDDDGLLELDNSFVLYDGGIRYGEHFLHYHQFLRRGFSSNPNFDFTGTFARYFRENSDTNQFRIAIDHRRIMRFEDWRQCMELDTWYGPGFDREKLDDPDFVGLTVVGRANPNPLDSYPLVKTEFLWKRNEQRDEIKSLEIEEISCPTRPYDNFHINRYAHAERDMARQTFQHFDCAAKIYNTNNYADRVGQTMPNNLKSAHYIKLFRIDGSVALDDWLSLLSMFYKGNEMIIEYFDPDLFDEKFRPKREALANALAKNGE